MKPNLRYPSFRGVLFRAVLEFIADDALTLSAALTFSTLLSFAPILILALWITSALGWSAQASILTEIGNVAGDQAREAAGAVLDSAAQRPAAGSWTGFFGIGVALIGATTVFAQLQTSLNRIWSMPETDRGPAIWSSWIRRRLLSMGLLAAIAFVLIASLLVSAGLGVIVRHAEWIGELINQALSCVVFALLFTGLFRYLPNARQSWQRALAGGTVTALLFVLGKALIGFYLAHGAVGSAYGAAGSLVVLLIWVYYSSAIFFFGAELVKAWGKQKNA